MKKIVLFLTIISSISFGAKTKFKDDQFIRDLFNSYWESWNKKDMKTLLTSFSEDCSYMNHVGKLAVGKGDIESYLAESFGKEFKNLNVKADNSDVKFLSRNVALYDQELELVDIKNKDEDKEPIRQHLTAVLTKKNGKWWVVAYRNYSLSRSNQ